MVNAERFFGEVGVREPAGVRHLIYDEAHMHEHAAEQEYPIAEGIQSGESNISGADGQRNDDVKEAH